MLGRMAKRFGWYIAEQLVLKITLAGSEPAIWRRVEVHSALTLEDLHYVIQNVFDWQRCHLYHFLIPPGGKLTFEGLRDAKRYMIPPPPGVPTFPEDAGDPRADEELVGRVFTDDCDQIIYEYDFGDSWEHVVKLEKRTLGGDQSFVPVCLAGENPAPIEDSGGIDGYYLRVEAYADKSHAYHDETVDWLGEDFVPAPFDLAVVNKRLKSTFRLAPKKTRKKAAKKKVPAKKKATAKGNAAATAKPPSKVKAKAPSKSAKPKTPATPMAPRKRRTRRADDGRSPALSPDGAAQP